MLIKIIGRHRFDEGSKEFNSTEEQETYNQEHVTDMHKAADIILHTFFSGQVLEANENEIRPQWRQDKWDRCVGHPFIYAASKRFYLDYTDSQIPIVLTMGKNALEKGFRFPQTEVDLNSILEESEEVKGVLPLIDAEKELKYDKLNAIYKATRRIREQENQFYYRTGLIAEVIESMEGQISNCEIPQFVKKVRETIAIPTTSLSDYALSPYGKIDV